MIVVIMGVAGSGKTTVGRMLADEMSWGFVDADDIHPLANIEKMRDGVPLTDDDRAPWLRSLRIILLAHEASDESLVLACSALTEGFRAALRTGVDDLRFVLLQAEIDVIAQRLVQREHHFFKAELLDSQFVALEVPLDAIVVNASQSPHAIVAHIRRELR